MTDVAIERPPAPSANARSRRRRRRTALYTAVAVAIVFAAFVGVLATRKSALDRQVRSPLLGQVAPAITGTSITSGANVTLASLQGKYVLVNFFASWCVPCQHEQPQLVKWAHEAPSHAIVGVLFSDTPAPAKKFLAGNAGDWPALNDASGQLALNYGVRGPPESYLLDPQGIVIAKFVGEVTATGLDRVVSLAEGARA
ncbi:MAG TPA: TlpA disulfide reductase family protein [Acidimicrobiales bacterium]|nr:TlpA disulfide reductase family protein [Acidimicrobiales bacterium]